MPKITSAFFDDENTPELRFEEPTPPAKPQRRAANYAATAPMPAYGVEADSYSELTYKEESVLKLEQELEKTRREAREMRARQEKEDRFTNGRRDICEKLARNIAKLDRELYNAQKAIEEISAARETYNLHLDALRSVETANGSKQTDDELDHAIGALEDAESEFGKTSRRLATVLPQIMPEVAHTNAGGVPHSFSTWMRAGFAFTLPVMIAAIIVTVLLKLLP